MMNKPNILRLALAVATWLVVFGSVGGNSTVMASPPTIESRGFYVTTADGVSIFVREKFRSGGDKVPVLLVHGTWSNSSTWDFPGRSVMDYLAERGYDVYALDLRGMGLSDHPANYLTIGLFERVGDVAAAASYIITTTGRQPVVIGHSQGAWLTILLAAYHPELPVGLGLSGMPGNGLYVPPDLIALLEAIIASGADRAAIPPEIAYLLAFGFDPVTGRPTISQDAFAIFAASLEPDSVPVLVQQGTPDFFNSVMAPALPTIHAPALVVDGALDFEVGEARARVLYDALGSEQKQIIILPRNAHFWFLEDNFHATMRAFDSFLAQF